MKKFLSTVLSLSLMISLLGNLNIATVSAASTAMDEVVYDFTDINLGTVGRGELPEGFERSGNGWNNIYEIGTYYETGDSGNKVLQLRNPDTETKKGKSVTVKIPFPYTSEEAFDAKISFKVKYKGYIDETLSKSPSFYGTLTDGDASSMFFGIHLGSEGNVGVSTASGSNYWCSGGKVLIEEADFWEKYNDKWLTVEGTYHFAGTAATSTQSYTIKDAEGNVIATQDPVRLANNSFTKPAAVNFTFNPNGVDVTGGKSMVMLDDIKFAYPKAVVDQHIVGFDFENVTLNPSNNIGDVPEGLEKSGKGWNNNYEIGTYYETGTSGNKVLQLRNPNTDSKKGKNVAASMPFPYTSEEAFDAKIKFRVKYNSTTVHDSTAPSFYATLSDGTGKSSMFFGIHLGADGNVGVSTAQGSQWWCHGGKVLITEADFWEKYNNTWLMVEGTYHFAGTAATSTQSYIIKDAEGEVIATQDPVRLANNSFTKPATVSFTFSPKSVDVATDKSNVMLDDIEVTGNYVETEEEVETVVEAFSVKVGDEVSTPQDGGTLSNEVNSFNVTFNAETSATATLTKAGGSAKALTAKTTDEISYSFENAEYLEAGKAYTLTVTYDTDKTYTYTFTATGATDVSVSEFTFVNGSTSPADGATVNVGDTINLKAKIVNPTGDTTKKAILVYTVYKNGRLDYIAMTEETPLGVGFNGTELTFATDYTVKSTDTVVYGFLWDGLTTMKPYENRISLNVATGN